MWSVRTPSSPAWWVASTALVPLLAALVALTWLVLLWWLPRRSCSRIAHLPHRRVHVCLSVDGFGVRTATERMEVAWSEVSEVRDLPSFLLVRLRSGANVPVPRAAVTPEAACRLRALVRRQGA